MKNKQFSVGKVYKLIKDYDRSWAWERVFKKCYLPKGTKLKYEGESIYSSFLYFRLLKKVDTWKDGKDTLVLILPELATKILKRSK